MNTGTIWSGVKIWDSYPLDIQKDAESDKHLYFDDKKVYGESTSSCICETAILNEQQDLNNNSGKEIDSKTTKNLDEIREKLNKTLQQTRRDRPFCLSYKDLEEYYHLGLFNQWEDLLLIVKLCHPLDWIDFWLFLEQKFPQTTDLEKARSLLLEGLLYLFQLKDSNSHQFFYAKTFAALHRKSPAQIYYIDCLAATVFGTSYRRDALSISLCCSRATSTVSTFKTRFDHACLFLNSSQAICNAITRYLQQKPNDTANQELNSILRQWSPKGWNIKLLEFNRINFEQFQLLASCFSFLGPDNDEVYQELIKFSSLEICLKYVKTKDRKEYNPVVNALKGRLHYRLHPFKCLDNLTEDQAADLADLLAREPLFYFGCDFSENWQKICEDLDLAGRSFFKENMTKALVKIVLEDPYINYKLLYTLKRLKLVSGEIAHLPSIVQFF